MCVPSPGFWIVLGPESIFPPTRGRTTRIKSGGGIFNLTLLDQYAAFEPADFDFSSGFCCPFPRGGRLPAYSPILRRPARTRRFGIRRFFLPFLGIQNLTKMAISQVHG